MVRCVSQLTEMSRISNMAAPMFVCETIVLKRLFIRRLYSCRHKQPEFRRYSNSHQNVRVRFAPSPTGNLHLGGLRTALYNFLFARSQNGSFILRIEDTDQTRIVPGALGQLQEILKWSGLEPDEGPHDGEYGPYIQSQRLHIYAENIKTLLNNGWAYPCFCSTRRLDLMRKEAARRGEKPKYDNRCRGIHRDQAQELLAEGKPHAIRLKMEPTPDPWDDLIKGLVSHNVVESEGDPILIKSDGFPTYHFANVVDDHYMAISHVLRGEEWLVSTAKHILLYKAFGWVPPQFGHLPLIVNQDGSKLSKRQGDIHVEHYRDNGYFPEAVLNYATSIGGGFHENNLTRTLGDMYQSFDINKLKKSPGRLDPTSLDTANRHVLQKTLYSGDNVMIFEMVEKVRRLVIKIYGERMTPGPLRDQILSEDYILSVMRWSMIDERTSKLTDFVSPEFSYLWVTPNPSTFVNLSKITDRAAPILASCLNWVKEQNNFDPQTLRSELFVFQKKNELKSKFFFPLVRLALTGQKQGAPLGEMMAVIGKDRVIMRLSTAINQLETKS